MNLTIQEPAIFQRPMAIDLPVKSGKRYNYVAIWDVLNVLSLYKPVIPYMTLTLNGVRAFPVINETFKTIKDGKCPEISQMMEVAYYVSIISLTIINPVYGMLAANVDSLYRITSLFYKDFQKDDKVINVAFGVFIFNSLSQLSLFSTSNPKMIVLTTVTNGVGKAINLFGIIKNKHKYQNIKMHLEIAHSLLGFFITFYRHQSAMNSI